MNPVITSLGDLDAPSALAVIATHWVEQVARGVIRFDPDQIFTRSITSDDGMLAFKVIFNAARKDRGQSKVA